MNELEKRISQANESYRLGAPIMSDVEYDALMDELTEKYPNSPLLQTGVINTPTNRKQKLPIPMYSLDKVKSVGELMVWVHRNFDDNDLLVITPKMDGISLVQSGSFGWTRGDGEYGQDCTSHLVKMKVYDPEEDFVVFGEAIMSRKNFSKYKDQFATARNMVGGLLGRDEPADELADVDFVRYGTNLVLDKIDTLDLLNHLNRTPIPFEVVEAKNLNLVDLDGLYNRWKENYCIDGLVIEANSASIREIKGREKNMNPAYARAYKHPNWSDTVIVRVEGITLETSKDGKRKPVINIEPTPYNGITISNVTGYNAAYLIDNHIHAGAKIEITRSGDVIPKHLETVEYNQIAVDEMVDSLMECSCCGEPTLWDSTLTEIVCINPSCKERNINELVHFFETVGVEEFGKLSVEQLYEKGYQTAENILNITVSNLSSLSGWGEKSSQSLVREFARVRSLEIPLARILHALNIFKGKFGETTCQLILDNIACGCDTLDDVLMATESVTLDQLISIHGVGEVTGSQFLSVFRSGLYKYSSLIRSFKFSVCNERKITGSALAGISVCLTGFRDKGIEWIVSENGGKIASGVSKGLTYLIVKDKDSTSSKAEKARSLGIEIINAIEFYAILASKGL